jgi:hypothetical protein
MTTATLFKSDKNKNLESTSTRWQFELSLEQEQRLQSLMSDFKVKSKKDLLNNGLSLLLWVQKELKEGRKIASIDEASNVYREIHMPIFDEIVSPSR